MGRRNTTSVNWTDPDQVRAYCNRKAREKYFLLKLSGATRALGLKRGRPRGTGSTKDPNFLSMRERGLRYEWDRT